MKKKHKLGYAQLANLQQYTAVSFGPGALGAGGVRGIGLEAAGTFKSYKGYPL